MVENTSALFLLIRGPGGVLFLYLSEKLSNDSALTKTSGKSRTLCSMEPPAQHWLTQRKVTASFFSANDKSKIEYTTSQSRTSRWLAPYKICKIILWQCHFKYTHTNDFTSEEIFVYNQEKDDIVEHLFLLRILIKFFIREGKNIT